MIGGWACVDGGMRNRFPKELVDVFVVGEGEETAREVLEVLIEDKRCEDVPGAIFSKKDKLNYSVRPPIINLNTIC